MSESANWVQRRAVKERVLDTGAIGVWNEVRSALQDACESYNEHYSPNPNRVEVECQLENGNRIRITRTLPGGPPHFQPIITQALVEFDSKIPSIRSTREESSASREFRISSDETFSYVVDGDARMAPDEVSRLILEPILFHGERRHPIFKVTT
jgi:hypothetical protein